LASANLSSPSNKYIFSSLEVKAINSFSILSLFLDIKELATSTIA
jgi:hypothetical protein